jgi:ABC-2 type transport system ATP-binding protein
MNQKNTVLHVTNLVKSFNTGFLPLKRKAITIVNNISFTLHQGEILGVLGPNGAGKTTTIQMLLSTMTPTSGSIIYFGKDLAYYRSEILQHVSFASTYVRLPGRLTVYENLDFYAQIYGLAPQERRHRIEKFLTFFNMWRLKDRYARALSAGEATRVMLAKAFLTSPAVVLLDEPTASLDPDIAHDVRTFVLEQRNDYGVAILFTSHNMDEVAAVCDRVLVLKNGSIIADDTPEHLAMSVSRAHVQLFVNSFLTDTEKYAAEQGLPYSTEGKSITIEVDEHQIADLLIGLASKGITYTQISIEKPTLQDYFLNIAKSGTADESKR